jgi:uncharacterized protein YbjT (DUF2867 family)
LSPPGAIVVTGAVGGEVVRRLHAAGQPVRAAVLDERGGRALFGPEVDLVPFAFDGPATHGPALAGARALLLM